MADNVEYNKKIKLIWDFHGPDAEKTAQHHAVHLNDFKVKENDDTITQTGHEKISDQHYIAYLNSYYSEMVRLRDTLKPKRGEYLE